MDSMPWSCQVVAAEPTADFVYPNSVTQYKYSDITSREDLFFPLGEKGAVKTTSRRLKIEAKKPKREHFPSSSAHAVDKRGISCIFVAPALTHSNMQFTGLSECA
jgi:hypothetical protein